mgnify:CR=1 FL=1
MADLFGFRFTRIKDDKNKEKFTLPSEQDGTIDVAGGGFFGQILDTDGRERTEQDLIRRYRDIAQQPECDSAIEDIVNEGIVANERAQAVQLVLDQLPYPMKIKKAIEKEFDSVLRLLDFDTKGHDIFRRWYVDGRLFYHKVIDPANPGEGLSELRYIDPRKIRKVTEYEEKKPQQLQGKVDLNQQLTTSSASYYLYNPKGLKNTGLQGIKIAPDSVTYCHSGIQDLNKNMVLSHLHKAIKAVNQLRMIEDSLVIYRLSRAPERRIFYIDVGNLPKNKAEQYLREVMGRYRNKLVYDANTGEIKDDKKFMSMLEDFWLPRREGGRGTEITTLPGGQNLGELEDVKYFQKKLYRSLNVPESRLESDSAFNVGRSAEITRDEVKFQKFVVRLRKRFSDLFNDLLRTQVVLKGIFTLEEWDEMKEHIQYDFIADNYFSELKEQEIQNARMALLQQMDPFVGRYFSLEYLRKQVLKQPEALFQEMDKQMEAEIKEGKSIDPLAMPAMEHEQMAMSLQPEPPDPAEQGIKPADYKKGDI